MRREGFMTVVRVVRDILEAWGLRLVAVAEAVGSLPGVIECSRVAVGSWQLEDIHRSASCGTSRSLLYRRENEKSDRKR